MIDSGSPLNIVVEAMQEPFPELTDLRLKFSSSQDLKFYGASTLPDSFLGGSAHGLRSIILDAVPYPGLPKLLLSATHLDYLCLSNIPYSGYFSPELISPH